METAQRFLATLPEGMASHPEAEVRASVVRTWAEGHDEGQLVEALGAYPEALAALRAPASSWVREVPATVVYLVIRELFFASDEAYVASAYRKNLAVLSGPVLGPLEGAADKDRLIRWSPKIYAQFHRGSMVRVRGDGGDLRFEYVFPSHLIPPLIARCHATSIAALLERIGRSAVLELEVHEPERAVFNVALAS